VPSKIHFTDLALRALPFSDTQVTSWDKSFPAFGLRVGKRSETFIVVRNGGHRLKIGDLAKRSLKDARTKARRVLADRTPERNPLGIPAAQALALFLKDRKKKNKPSTYRETERLLKSICRLCLRTASRPMSPRSKSSTDCSIK
jgi:hypothetical protein